MITLLTRLISHWSTPLTLKMVFSNLKQNSRPLKGLSHEIDFKNVDENGQILALTRAAAGF